MPHASDVSLRPVTFATVREIIALDAGEKRRDYVAPNAVSLAEAQFNPGAWFRAVYAGETPAGFILLSDPSVPGAVSRGPLSPGDMFLWRFMIDHRFQGRGYGRSALDLARRYIETRPDAKRWVSSFVPGPDGPEGFYLRYGFTKTGGFRAGGREVEIAFSIAAAPLKSHDVKERPGV
jgi:diamine N-acetyltransferase